MSHSADSTQIETFPLPLEPAVYFIGAGPGDPDLLTVKALKILQRADVIVFADSLVPKQILQGVRTDAEIVRTGSKTLEEIVPLMIERVRSHKSVVRLHSGDLSLYSAIHEQIQALAEAEIPFELIPGISAFQAATAKLGVELTVPGLVQTIILTRVSGRASAVPEPEELTSLAAHQASLCLYLSARHVEDAQAKLLEHYPADTPVAVCFRIGWPDEKIWLVPLTEMAAITQKENLIRTTLYLVSPALRTVATLGAPGVQSTVVSKELLLDVSKAATQEPARSRLYHPEHSHLFRRSSRRSLP
ncbi:MAG TPA: precorrin-4 C(11)-methyltransferase [Cyanobacteria bacterium UBA8553]|nr:precorrin-4 C(11)-methyltransferase [Cyanobacteria bacterium UBA8553]HAJ64324.1 precorrin-4 C(11)-methyltransferase [Cyanobacteria bacterium UBA8543]